MAGKRLFEITEDIRWLEDLLDAADDDGREYSEEDQARILEMLEQADVDQMRKLDGYAVLIRRMAAEAAVAKAEASYWAGKAATKTKRADWLKGLLKQHMADTGQERIETGKFTFALQDNGGRLPVILDDEEDVPVEYKTTPEPVPNRVKIYEDLLAGMVVPGARLGERGRQLRIR